MAVKTIDQPIPTTIYHIFGSSPICPLLVLLPGNPGLAEFYSKYLLALKKKHPEFELVAPSLLGFSSTVIERMAYDPSLKVYTLQEQINHNIELIKVLTANHHNKPRDLYLLGHSVGAWIAQRVAVGIEGSDTVNLKFVGLLTPTIKDIAISERGINFVRLCKYLPVGILGGRLLQALNWMMPTSALEALVRYIMGSELEDHAYQVAYSFASRPQFARQVIVMAIEEMKRIDGTQYPEDLGNFWDENQPYRIWGMFAYKDHWIAESTQQEIIETFGNQRNVDFLVLDETCQVPHNFCVRTSEVVASYTSEAIKHVKDL